jgi:hypothetical protein
MDTTADVWNEDCIRGLPARLKPESVHLTVTSIPFEELFTYSGKLEDVGNNGSTIDVKAGRFLLNLRFLIEQLLRVTAAGCNVCIHIQQLLAYKNQHGFSGRRDFRGAVIDGFIAGGFRFTGEVAIVKDPQAMAQRLNLHSLQFKTGYARSATQWAMAPNDFVLIFQKPGQVAVPVRPLIYHDGKDKPTRRAEFYEQIGRADPMAYARHLRAWAKANGAKNPAGWISADDWIKWARGVWDDIDEFDILDGARSAKESDEEKHVCPLQLEVIRRLVLLYSNPVDVQPDVKVLDPFDGIGSTVHECILLNRNACGFELKESYYANSLKHVRRARVELARRLRDEGRPADMFSAAADAREAKPAAKKAGGGGGGGGKRAA